MLEEIYIITSVVTSIISIIGFVVTYKSLQELIFITGFQLINGDGFRGYMSSAVLLRE